MTPDPPAPGAAPARRGAALFVARPPERFPVQEVQLVVKAVVTPQGVRVLGVTGPIDNKVLAYGILEEAKDAVRAFHAQKEASAIQTPTPRQTRVLGG